MGTHPIFESDFDCLTEWRGVLGLVLAREIERRRKTEKEVEVEAETEVETEKITKEDTDQGHGTGHEVDPGTENDLAKEEDHVPGKEKTKNVKKLQKKLLKGR